jgi:LmbE family N-acetylglucosaminyl deacetylase
MACRGYLAVRSYDDVITSKEFLGDLEALNKVIAQSLSKAGLPVIINGNVCYSDKDEDFDKGTLSSVMEPKRKALVAMAQRARCFVEVGIAGGHAVLLALHANPDLKAVGIDMAVQAKPSWPRVDIFVPAATKWLEKRFPGRFRFLRLEAIEGLQRVAETMPFGPVDMVHLDGGKLHRMEELAAIWPALAEHGYLMQGDYRNGNVRGSTRQMIEGGLARELRGEDLPPMQNRTFKVVEIGPGVLGQSVQLRDFRGKRVLLCTAHQDDELLFAGGLLSKIAGKAEVNVACFFRPMKGRKDSASRIGAMQTLCAELGVSCVQYPFAVEAPHRRLRRYIALDDADPTMDPAELRPLESHGLYPTLLETAVSTLRLYEPDIVITHNPVGEYGHLEHVFLHRTMMEAARRANITALMTFGAGQEHRAGLTVTYDARRKKRLFKHYRPQWDGLTMYDFALDPERFVREPLFPAAR